jgi:hypothetical protein
MKRDRDSQSDYPKEKLLIGENREVSSLFIDGKAAHAIVTKHVLV